MSDATPTLGNTSHAAFLFGCSQCGRKGRYRRETLIRLFGETAKLPSLPRLLAEHRGCPYVHNLPLGAGIACGVHFDLAREILERKRQDYADKHRR